MGVLDPLKGFGVTFKNLLHKPVTIGYPGNKTPVYPRFRGRHRLWTFDDGLEKCVGCSLCAAACPADATPAAATDACRSSAATGGGPAAASSATPQRS